jgi:hypothetical protein
VNRLFLLVLALVLPGCGAALPDVRPYTEASVSLRSAIAESGRAWVAELAKVDVRNERLEQRVQEEEAAWRARVAAMDAVVGYAQNLETIIDSGETGGTAVESVAQSIETLARASAVVPGVQTSGVAVDAWKLIAGSVAQLRRQKALDLALERAQPVLERMLDLLRKDLDDLGRRMDARLDAELTGAFASLRAELAFREALVAERRKLYESEPAALDDVKRTRLRELEAQLRDMDAWYRPLLEQRAELERRRFLERELLAATTAGLEEWARAHEAIVRALRTGRSRLPNVDRVTWAASEIRGLVQQLQAQ